MDPKATAKSKRSHSLQGKRNSPHSSHVASPSKDKKKQPQPQPQQQPQKHHHQQTQAQLGGKRPTRPPGRSLPSNWDRYEEEDLAEGEEGHGPVAVGSTMGGGEGVVLKSKGADFGELIEQAMSRQKDGDGGTESLFDDSVPEYIQGLSSLLSARGNSLLLQCRNDNFIVDDDAISIFEVPFLALNHDALAAQLAKAKLSKRIFIDAKYIPEEMEIDLSNEILVQDSNYEDSLGENSSRLCNDDERNILSNEDISESTEGQDIMLINSGKKLSSPLSSSEGAKENPSSSSVSLGINSDLHTKPDLPSKFGAAAEADLDMLLDSFAQVKLFDSSGVSTNSHYDSSAQLIPHYLSGYKSDQPLRNNFYASSYTDKQIPSEATADGFFTDLPVFSSQNDAGSNDTTFLGETSQTRMGVTLSHDNVIDNLLAETSTDMKNSKLMRYPESERNLNNADISSMSSHSVTKALDELDSWLDTL